MEPALIKAVGYTKPDIDNSLRLYIDFSSGIEETIMDLSIFNNHGINHGGEIIEGYGGNAIFFNGDNAYLDCGNDPSLEITGAITVEAWVEPVLDSNYRGIVVHNMWYHWGMRKEHNNVVYCHMRYSDDSRCSLYIPTLTAEWQHIAFTWDKTVASNNAKAYKNGVLVDIETCGVGLDLHATNSDLNIGWAGDKYFNGTIDEVRIYNRALSAEEIKNHYNQR